MVHNGISWYFIRGLKGLHYIIFHNSKGRYLNIQLDNSKWTLSYFKNGRCADIFYETRTNK